MLTAILSGSPAITSAQEHSKEQNKYKAASAAKEPPAARISIEDYIDLTTAPLTPPARMQKGQQANRLKTTDGLDFARFARRLGHISAISRGAEGELYVADKDSGRIFIIPDRNQDGRAEQIRPLPYRFNDPSALVQINETLYVADKDAIWTLPVQSGMNRSGSSAQQNPTRLASLKNIQSRGAYFLTPQSHTANRAASNLILGYSAQDGMARLILIDINTGQAKLHSETSGELVGLMTPPNIDKGTSKAWVAFQNQDGLYIGPNFNTASHLGGNLSIAGLALPQSGLQETDWPKALNEHILISQTHPIRITALPTSLGLILPKGRDIFSGFQDARTAWGQAGVLHMDRRGLFVADPFNGDIWLLKPKSEKPLTAKKSQLKTALNKLKAVEETNETPLRKNPLDGIYDSLFPDSNAEKNTNKNKATQNTPKP